MVITAQQEVTFEVVQDLVAKVPSDIKLTFVGGQALSFWAANYVEIYPEEFDGRDDIVMGTSDIDIVGSSVDAERCAHAWGGKVQIPKLTDQTPNSAIVTIEVAGIGEVTIDFLIDYMKPPRVKAKYFEEVVLSASKPIYILGPLATLLAKVANTLVLRRDDAHALGQLRSAIIITRCFIRDALERGEQHEACKVIDEVLHIAKSAGIGWPLYNHHEVDLLDALPTDRSGLDDRYVEKQLEPAIVKILQRRELD